MYKARFNGAIESLARMLMQMYQLSSTEQNNNNSRRQVVHVNFITTNFTSKIFPLKKFRLYGSLWIVQTPWHLSLQSMTRTCNWFLIHINIPVHGYRIEELIIVQHYGKTMHPTENGSPTCIITYKWRASFSKFVAMQEGMHTEPNYSGKHCIFVYTL